MQVYLKLLTFDDFLMTKRSKPLDALFKEEADPWDNQIVFSHRNQEVFIFVRKFFFVDYIYNICSFLEKHDPDQKRRLGVWNHFFRTLLIVSRLQFGNRKNSFNPKRPISLCLDSLFKNYRIEPDHLEWVAICFQILKQAHKFGDLQKFLISKRVNLENFLRFIKDSFEQISKLKASNDSSREHLHLKLFRLSTDVLQICDNLQIKREAKDEEILLQICQLHSRILKSHWNSLLCLVQRNKTDTSDQQVDYLLGVLEKSSRNFGYLIETNNALDLEEYVQVFDFEGGEEMVVVLFVLDSISRRYNFKLIENDPEVATDFIRFVNFFLEKLTKYFDFLLKQGISIANDISQILCRVIFLRTFDYISSNLLSYKWDLDRVKTEVNFFRSDSIFLKNLSPIIHMLFLFKDRFTQETVVELTISLFQKPQFFFTQNTLVFQKIEHTFSFNEIKDLFFVDHFFNNQLLFSSIESSTLFEKYYLFVFNILNKFYNARELNTLKKMLLDILGPVSLAISKVLTESESNHKIQKHGSILRKYFIFLRVFLDSSNNIEITNHIIKNFYLDVLASISGNPWWVILLNWTEFQELILILSKRKMYSILISENTRKVSDLILQYIHMLGKQPNNLKRLISISKEEETKILFFQKNIPIAHLDFLIKLVHRYFNTVFDLECRGDQIVFSEQIDHLKSPNKEDVLLQFCMELIDTYIFEKLSKKCIAENLQVLKPLVLFVDQASENCPNIFPIMHRSKHADKWFETFFLSVASPDQILVQLGYKIFIKDLDFNCTSGHLQGASAFYFEGLGDFLLLSMSQHLMHPNFTNLCLLKSLFPLVFDLKKKPIDQKIQVFFDSLKSHFFFSKDLKGVFLTRDFMHQLVCLLKFED